MKEVYLDHAATTKLSKEALQAMLPYLLEEYGNPSSPYDLGRRAKSGMENARKEIAETLHCSPGEIFFTSGGTEADNWAVHIGSNLPNKNSGRKHMICSEIEHPALKNKLRKKREEGFDIDFIPCDENGIVQPETVKKYLREDTSFVSVMFANNEIGTIQPVNEISEMCRERNIAFHTDAVQAYGHLPIDVKALGVSMLSASGHKFGGPKGIGFLYISHKIQSVPFIFGGGQENRMRSGTENVASIVGMGKAAKISHRDMEKNARREMKLRNYMTERIENEIPFVRLNGSRTKRLNNNMNISFSYVEGKSLVSLLDMVGICCSGGSACSTHKNEPSEVLTAMGLSEQLAKSALRMTFGGDNTMEEAEYVLYHLKNCVALLRERNPLYQRFIRYNAKR